MTKEEFNRLSRGDLVRHKNGTLVSIVNANYVDHVTAVSTFDITNPSEWEIVAKCEYLSDS